MKFNKKLAFTLIELIISMTIFFMMVMMTYLPYNFFMNKQKVKNSIKEISQSMYEVRNMAINGISNSSNKSVGLYLDINNDNIIQILSYPHTFTGSDITNQISNDIELVKTYKLIEGIGIKDIAGKDNMLFFFDAIDGKGKYYTYNNLGSREEILLNEIEVNISYKNSPLGSPLSGKLKYFTNTNIVDY